MSDDKIEQAIEVISLMRDAAEFTEAGEANISFLDGIELGLMYTTAHLTIDQEESRRNKWLSNENAILSERLISVEEQLASTPIAVCIFCRNTMPPDIAEMESHWKRCLHHPAREAILAGNMLSMFLKDLYGPFNIPVGVREFIDEHIQTWEKAVK